MFILFLIFVLLSIVMLMSNNTVPKTTCDQIGKPHKWVTKKVGENEYLVCEACRMLPGGHKEEGDGHSG